MFERAPFPVFLLALMLGAGETAVAQEDRGEFVASVDRLQGLSNSAIICLFKDNEELMWMGTYDGINCFDSKKMEVYRADFSKSTTLDNNVIYGIHQADGNNLWISTLLGENRFSKDKKEVVANYRVPLDSHLLSNSRGETWLVSSDSTAYYNTMEERFVSIEMPPVGGGNFESRLFVAHDGTLWLFPADYRGEVYQVALGAFDRPEGEVAPSVTRYRFHHRAVEEIFPNNDTSFCFVDEASDLFIYDVASNSKMLIRNIDGLMRKYGDIIGVQPFYDDIIIAFRTNGLIRLATDDGYREEIIDRNLRIFSLYKDAAQGTLWTGTDGMGVMIYAKRRSIATNLLTNSLSPNFTRPVRSITTDRNGGLWFGTKGDGLIHIDDYADGISADKAEVFFPGKRQSARSYTREETEFPIYTLQPDLHSDGLWVGSGTAGLFHFDFTDRVLRSAVDASGMGQPSEIHAIRQVDDQTMFVATAAGTGFRRLTLDRSGGRIVIRNQKQYSFQYGNEPINTFFAMVPVGDSVLWLGSREKGLVRFNVHTEEYRVVCLSELAGRAVDDVLAIHLAGDGTGEMFAGTTTGLVRLTFDEAGEVVRTRYTGREQGLLNDMIHGILEDENGFLWLSTNRGLVKFNTTDNTSRNYYHNGGMRIGEFSDDAYYKCPYTARLFFGGIDGLLYMDDHESSSPEFYPPIVLRGLSFGQREVNFRDYLVSQEGERGGSEEQMLAFKRPKEGFSVSFVVPDYVASSDIEYSWRLERHDRDWSPFGAAHEAVYRDVPPGRYVLHIRYRNDVFNSETRSISIPLHIIPLWYQTTAFTLFLTLIGIAAAAGLVYASRRILRNNLLVRRLLASPGELSQTALLPETEEVDAGAGLGGKEGGVTTGVREGQGLIVVCTTREQVEFVRRIVALIEGNIRDENLGAAMLADRMNMSLRHFYRKFKECSRVSISELILHIRMKKAAALLLEGRLSIFDVMVDVGISSRSYFHKEFVDRFGMTPKLYRETAGSGLNL